MVVAVTHTVQIVHQVVHQVLQQEQVLLHQMLEVRVRKATFADLVTGAVVAVVVQVPQELLQ